MVSWCVYEIPNQLGQLASLWPFLSSWTSRQPMACGGLENIVFGHLRLMRHVRHKSNPFISMKNVKDYPVRRDPENTDQSGEGSLYGLSLVLSSSQMIIQPIFVQYIGLKKRNQKVFYKERFLVNESCRMQK